MNHRMGKKKHKKKQLSRENIGSGGSQFIDIDPIIEVGWLQMVQPQTHKPSSLHGCRAELKNTELHLHQAQQEVATRFSEDHKKKKNQTLLILFF